MARLTVFNPWRDFSSLQNRVNRLFDETLGSFTGDQEALDTYEWAPTVDIYEEDKNYVFEADLPGFKKEDIKIDIKNNTLNISGERKSDSKVNEDNYVRVERRYGRFSRSFTLPNIVDAEKIKANYKDGVLKLTVPKKEEALPKSISIDVE